MEILHLTDLHITDDDRRDGTTLSGIWEQAKRELPRLGIFDFVVVSGDLTQNARDEEYLSVGEFLDELVKKHVRNAERKRVILVPGNHDINRKASYRAEIPDPSVLLTNDAMQKAFASFLNDPEKSSVRARFKNTGEIKQIWQVDDTKYPLRFGACQNFFDKFYAPWFPDQSAGDHAFSLCSANESKHFSAHVFGGAKIAFYGFNSCQRLDEDWTGAHISKHAVAVAAKHADLHAPLDKGWIRVAVWHHGLKSKRGRPDRIMPEELEAIGALSPAIGMHGHTHRDELDFLRGKIRHPFTIVATGSFAIDEKARPLANQFSVVSLTRSTIRRQLYTKIKTGAWCPDPPDKQDVVVRAWKDEAPIVPIEFERSRIETHRRHAVVDDHGIAHVAVHLDEAIIEDSFTLAATRSAYTNVLAQREATCDSGVIDVDPHANPDGSWTFSIDASGTKEHSDVKWGYMISNAFALNADELLMRDKTSASYSREGHDCFVHVLRAQCHELALEIELPSECISRVEGSAQSRDEHGEWHLDSKESRRIKVRATKTNAANLARCAKLNVVDPIPGHRYVLSYKLAREDMRAVPDSVRGWREGAEAGGLPDAAQALRAAVNCCRDDVPVDGCLRARLEKDIGRKILDTLAVHRDDPPLEWVAYLWQPNDRVLLPCFGKFPGREWCARFKYGEGIVGHGFRRRAPVAYFSSEDRVGGRRYAERVYSNAMIYRSAGDARHSGVWLDDQAWIVALPIVKFMTGPAVGMLGFAGRTFDRSNSASAWLMDFADRATRKDGGPAAGLDDDDTKTIRTLVEGVSYLFWRAAAAEASGRELGSGRKEAALIVATHWNRRAEERTSEGCDTMNVVVPCDKHGSHSTKVLDRSTHGLLLRVPVCDWVEENRRLDLLVDGQTRGAQIRHVRLKGGIAEVGMFL